MSWTVARKRKQNLIPPPTKSIPATPDRARTIGAEGISPPPASIVTVGRLGGPFGIKGWIHVRSYTRSGASLLDFSPWFLDREPEAGLWREWSPEKARVHGQDLVAKFSGLNDPESVQQLRGAVVGVRRSSFPELAHGEFYWVDLIGTPVTTETGARLGHVTEIFETGANAVMRVESEENKRMIPFADPVLREVTPGHEIVVDWDPDWS